MSGDANPCSRTAPCKTFAGAISKTAAAGEINCLDSGGFGTLTITKSISLVCNGVIGSVLAAGTVGFNINVAATDTVVIDGIEIEGAGTGTTGINVVGSGKIFLHNVSIRHFTGNGISLNGVAGARLNVMNSFIVNNAGGFDITGAAGAANVGLSLNTVYDNNPNFSIQVTAPSALIVGHNTLLGAAASINNVGGAAVTSFGDNEIGGTGTATTVIPLR
ncbi:MAG: hypothetical protein NVSMB26_17140 [Beijerinckiaceae bacterium]